MQLEQKSDQSKKISLYEENPNVSEGKIHAKPKKDDSSGIFGGLLLTAIIFQLGSFGIIPAFIISMGSLWLVKKITKYFSNRESGSFNKNNQEDNSKPLQKITLDNGKEKEIKKSKKKWIWGGIVLIVLILGSISALGCR